MSCNLTSSCCDRQFPLGAGILQQPSCFDTGQLSAHCTAWIGYRSYKMPLIKYAPFSVKTPLQQMATQFYSALNYLNTHHDFVSVNENPPVSDGQGLSCSF